jgi:N-acyl-L-homoserine lactone synthetase
MIETFTADAVDFERDLEPSGALADEVELPEARARLALEDTLTDIQRLRYDVYCVERRFIPPAECPEALERDVYDARSTHFGARDTAGSLVATVRLVRHSPLGFPLEQHAQSLSPEFHRLQRASTAEISRLIVAKSHRRNTLRDPLLLLGLLRSAYEESVRLDISWVLAAMEDGLCRLLRRLGFPWSPIGEPTDYFGKVVPYLAPVEALRPVLEDVSRLVTPAPFRYFRVSSGR